MVISLLSPKKILTRRERNTPSPVPSTSATAAAATAAAATTTTNTANTTTNTNNKPHYILAPPKARNSTPSPIASPNPNPNPSITPSPSTNPHPKYTSLLPKLDVKPLPPVIVGDGSSAPNSEGSSLYGSSPSSPKLPTHSLPISPLKAPRLNYSNDSYSITSSNNQNHRRTLSDKIKTTPSSFVRQSRIYSNPDFENINSNPSLNSLTGKSLLLQNKLETDNLPPELIPIVNLINAHKLRTYAIGTFQIPAILNDGEKAWLEVEAKLSGNELAIWRPNLDLVDDGDDDDDDFIVGENDEFKPKYINLIDSKIEIGHDLQIQIVHDFQQDNKLLIKFNNESDFIKWIAAINLSKFEYTSLNESFTASILSYKGTKLSDLHVLLSSKKRFPKYEWCNIRFPQISAKYLKVYLAILPPDAKNSLGRIEIYTSDKVQKKNLIAYINQLDNIFNVYPEHSSMIDFNPIMKLNGEIFINRSFEYLFYNEPQMSKTASSSPPPPPLPLKQPSRVDSTHSLSSVTFTSPASPAPHSRNVSVNSTTSSFFNYAPSPKVDDASISPKKKNSNRNRSVSSPAKILSGAGGYFSNSSSSNATPMTNNTTSTSLNSSKSSTSSFFKKHINNFVLAEFVYIIPISHPGVSPIETMIRNFIPIIDAFKLYGRPNHLISDKTNQSSLLFALPSLPRYQYINDTDAQIIVDKNLESINEDWSDATWRSVYKNFISQKYLAAGKKYQGFGNIHDLYNDLDLNLQDISSPTILLPKVGSNESDNFSEIMTGFSTNTLPSRTTSPLPPVSQQQQQQQATTMSNSNYLGEPIQLPPRHVSSPLSSVYTNNDAVESGPIPSLAPPPTSSVSHNHNINNLRLNEQDVHNYNYNNQYSSQNDRSLDPIADMPTPLDEIHAYPNLVNLKLSDSGV